MIDQAFSSVGFWIAMAILVVLVAEALLKWDQPWAKPSLVVYGTIGVWYLGDFLLADPRDFGVFTSRIVEFAFLQVAAFLILVRALQPSLTRRFRGALADPGRNPDIPQIAIVRSFLVVSATWTALFTVAVILRHGEWLPLIWPLARNQKLGMFSHGGIGDRTSFLLATAGYIQILACALFGPIAVLARGRVRYLAMIMIAISWPYFFFDRVRNSMLALLLPGVACFWIFSPHRLVVKAAVSLVLFAAVALWFQQVMTYRGRGGANLETLVTASGTTSLSRSGLDMMKELCWIDTFVESGKYRVNWGQRYFAEAVNVVPRAVWSNKPTIGLDYAIARGFLGNNRRTINATVATGMIGQGVVNFGPYMGVLAAALIISAWIAILSRLWVQRASLSRLLLFLMGLGLTFNMGRDITLLVLFPFVFGYIGVRFVEYYTDNRPWSAPQKRSTTTLTVPASFP